MKLTVYIRTRRSNGAERIEMDVSKLRLLTEKQVCEIYNLGLRFLRLQRMRNEGPAFIKTSGRLGHSGGRVLYRVDDVEQWLNTRPAGGAGKIAS